jgi:hypothetical protein
MAEYPDFIRREIDAINEKWREIQKGSELPVVVRDHLDLFVVRHGRYR